jgi:hypothetical protein
LAISDKKNSADDGIDLFRRNSGCSAEQKTLGLLFQTFLQRREMLGILYRGTKIKANSGNSILNHSTEVKTTGGIPFHGTKIEANTWNSVPNHSVEEKNNSEFRSEEQKYS